MNNHNSSQSIYVIGFPKSGNTWLTRLIADALRMRVGSGMRVDDELEIATSVNKQLDLPDVTDFTIRKTHFLPEVLKQVRNEEVAKGVYIYRDFRDIIISSFFYKYGYNFQKVLQKGEKNLFDETVGWAMRIFFLSKGINPNKLLLKHTAEISKNWAHDVGPWSLHIQAWMDFNKNNINNDIVFVAFEDLLSNTLNVLIDIINGLNITLPSNGHLRDAIKRQSFEEQKKYFENISSGTNLPRGRDYNIKFFRKGIAGDWKDYFTRDMGEIVERNHGEMLSKLQYVIDERWYEEI